MCSNKCSGGVCQLLQLHQHHQHSRQPTTLQQHLALVYSQLQSVDQTTMKVSNIFKQKFEMLYECLIFQAFSLLALVAAAYASDPYAPPAPYAPPVPAYAPAPVVHAVHAAPAYHAPVVHAAPAYHAPAPAYHADPYHEEKPKDYQFGYDVHGYDEYGNPNVHSRVEQRDGYNVKGN